MFLSDLPVPFGPQNDAGAGIERTAAERKRWHYGIFVFKRNDTRKNVEKLQFYLCKGLLNFEKSKTYCELNKENVGSMESQCLAGEAL